MFPGEAVTFPGSQGQLVGRLQRTAGPPRAYALFAHCFTCGKDIHAARRIAQQLTAALAQVGQLELGLAAVERVRDVEAAGITEIDVWREDVTPPKGTIPSIPPWLISELAGGKTSASRREKACLAPSLGVRPCSPKLLRRAERQGHGGATWTEDTT